MTFRKALRTIWRIIYYSVALITLRFRRWRFERRIKKPVTDPDALRRFMMREYAWAKKQAEKAEGGAS